MMPMMDLSLQQWHAEDPCQRRLAFIISCIVYHLLFQSTNPRVPYHTSVLSSEAWIYELITGHPNRICHNLGVSLQVFEARVQILQQNDVHRSHNGISVE